MRTEKALGRDIGRFDGIGPSEPAGEVSFGFLESQKGVHRVSGILRLFFSSNLHRREIQEVMQGSRSHAMPS